jgi:hypothetical protein
MRKTVRSRILHLALRLLPLLFLLAGLPKAAWAQDACGSVTESVSGWEPAIGYDCVYDFVDWTGYDGLIEGTSWIITNGSDVYAEVDEQIDYGLYIDGYDANVNFHFTQTSPSANFSKSGSNDDGDTAEYDDEEPLPVDSHTGYILDAVYNVAGDNGLYDWCFDPCGIFDDPFCYSRIHIGTQGVLVGIGEPSPSTISPNSDFVGQQNGTVLINGDYLADPFLGYVGVQPPNGVTITGGGVTQVDRYEGTATQLQINYTISSCATTGSQNFYLSDLFGQGHPEPFTIVDPTPVITSVVPQPWPAGSTSLPVTINGYGFGTNPMAIVAGNQVAFAQSAGSDTQITGTVTIGNVSDETATVVVQANGYCGNSFFGNGASSTSNPYTVPVTGATGPTPQILLYGQPITATQANPLSVTVGQQMALSATVSGVTISTRSWTGLTGTAVGGYSNAGGSAPCLTASNCPPPDTGGGKVLGLPPNNTDSYTFYWVSPSSAGTPWQVSYGYTASSGMQGATTAYFNVTAPSNASVAITKPPSVAILYPPIMIGGQPSTEITMPILIDGTASGTGMKFEANAAFTCQTNTCGYQWVQLVSKFTSVSFGPNGPRPPSPDINGAPYLDTEYPYGHHCLGATPCTVVTTTQTNDTSIDSPYQRLLAGLGEFANSFSATMYLMWTPDVLNGCPNGSACTIPVPLGSVTWQFAGDAINTLKVVQTSSGFFPMWMLNPMGPPPPSSGAFVPDTTSFPGWTQVINPMN